MHYRLYLKKIRKRSESVQVQSANDDLSDSSAIKMYIKSVSSMNKSTAREYYFRLVTFQKFIQNEYDISLDNLIRKLRIGSEDPYDVLSGYVVHLQNNFAISAATSKLRIITAKNFLEYNDVDISPRKFRFKVKIPKVVRKAKKAIDKEDIREILNACSDIRLKTYVTLLAAGGFRAAEALSIRVEDLDFEGDPAKVFVRGEYTKTRTDRYVFLTNEVVQQLRRWFEYKYRKRRICYQDSNHKKTITEYRTPERRDSDLIFALRQHSEKSEPHMLYYDLANSFGKTLDRIGKGKRENNSNNYSRRQITLHSFRRFVKTTISDLGYQDFSEYFIGHSGSSYWTKKESEKAQIFKRIEPYLTFLDYEELERKGADIASQLEEKDRMIQNMMRKQEQFEQLIQSLIDSGQLQLLNNQQIS
jgi:integrase